MPRGVVLINHTVEELAVVPALVLQILPDLVPASTISEFVGATAIAEIFPVVSCWLARVQLEAPLSVRYMNCPPIQSRCELEGSIVKGVINAKHVPQSVIPVVERENDDPPFVDFLIESLVFSA